jgi:hypothetical protein
VLDGFASNVLDVKSTSTCWMAALADTLQQAAKHPASKPRQHLAAQPRSTLQRSRDGTLQRSREAP